MDDINEFLTQIALGRSPNRHGHNIPGAVIDELEKKGWLDRDTSGQLVAGELLIAHLGIPEEIESHDGRSR